MALDLEIAGEIRELTDAELAEAEASTAKPPILKRLRDSHHAVARGISKGLSPTEISLATGYSPSRISILQQDPSFRDLVAHYQRTAQEAQLDIEGRIVGLLADHMQEMQERLHDAPEEISYEQISDNTKWLLDRAGYAPISRSININKSVGIGDRLDRLNQRGKREDAA